MNINLLRFRTHLLIFTLVLLALSYKQKRESMDSIVSVTEDDGEEDFDPYIVIILGQL